jgi:hypothetical protein
MPFISGIPSFCARGESTDKGHLALPFICGMLSLIGGQSLTPFFQARRDPTKPIFMPLRRLNGN